MPKHLKLPKHFRFTHDALMKRCKHLAKLLPHEVRQQVLDGWHARKTLGQISDEVGVEVEIVGAIVEMNTEKRNFNIYRKESI